MIFASHLHIEVRSVNGLGFDPQYIQEQLFSGPSLVLGLGLVFSGIFVFFPVRILSFSVILFPFASRMLT